MELWHDVIMEFMNQGTANGVLEKRRKAQTLSWVYSMVDEHLHNLFYRAPEVAACQTQVENAVVNGKLAPTLAVQELISKFAATDLTKQSLTDSSPFEIT